MELCLYTFRTSAINTGEWQLQAFVILALRRALGTHQKGNWVVSVAGFYLCLPVMEHRFFVVESLWWLSYLDCTYCQSTESHNSVACVLCFFHAVQQVP